MFDLRPTLHNLHFKCVKIIIKYVVSIHSISAFLNSIDFIRIIQLLYKKKMFSLFIIWIIQLYKWIPGQITRSFADPFRFLSGIIDKLILVQKWDENNVYFFFILNYPLMFLGAQIQVFQKLSQVWRKFFFNLNNFFVIESWIKNR